jgi:hypothetical protein
MQPEQVILQITPEVPHLTVRLLPAGTINLQLIIKETPENEKTVQGCIQPGKMQRLRALHQLLSKEDSCAGS